MAFWARGWRFWNLYTQLGLRLAMLVAYIVIIVLCARGTQSRGSRFILAYCLVGFSLVYNIIHFKSLYMHLIVDKCPGQSRTHATCVVVLEILAAIVTASVGIGTLVFDGNLFSSLECSPGVPYCDEIVRRRNSEFKQAFYAACCLWAISGLHFFLMILASIQCCTNEGLDVPESAIMETQLRQGLAVRHSGRGRGTDGTHELPAYRPPDSITHERRLSDEPPPYVARPPSTECTRPAATSVDSCPR
ncbi:hypothetical protein V8F20_006094 [Naviculisporaceae sp. PSN 640]